MFIDSDFLNSSKWELTHLRKWGRMKNNSSIDISSQSGRHLDLKKLIFNLPRLKNLCLNSEQARYAQNYLKHAHQLRKLNIKITNTIETTDKVIRRFFSNLKYMKPLSSIQIQSFVYLNPQS